MAGRRRGRDDEYSEPRNPPRTAPVAPVREPPADIPALTEKTDRVAWIVDRMRELSWPVWPESLKYRQRLADAWGISESTVRDYSAEAHRVVELDPVDRSHVAQDIARQLDAIALDALATVNEVTGLPDYPSAIKALTEKARFLGAEPEKTIKHTGSISLESLTDLSKRLAEATGEDPDDGAKG